MRSVSQVNLTSSFGERRWSASLGNKLTIKRACTILGFKSPPTDKKTLKTSFVKLAKINHPDVVKSANDKLDDATRDRNDARSQDRMSEITEAYKLLQGLLDNRVGGGGEGKKSEGGEDIRPPWWEGDADAKGFQAPSFSVSSGDMWLPWQKSGPSRTSYHNTAVGDVASRMVSSSNDFLSFRAEYRQYENKMREAEAARMATTSPAPSSSSEQQKTPPADASAQTPNDGSQFTKEHFQKERMKRVVFGDAESTACFKRRSSLDLLVMYIKDRSLGKLFRSIQYILSGK